jgi:hypothetical protein
MIEHCRHRQLFWRFLLKARVRCWSIQMLETRLIALKFSEFMCWSDLIWFCAIVSFWILIWMPAQLEIVEVFRFFYFFFKLACEFWSSIELMVWKCLLKVFLVLSVIVGVWTSCLAWITGLKSCSFVSINSSGTSVTFSAVSVGGADSSSLNEMKCACLYAEELITSSACC